MRCSGYLLTTLLVCTVAFETVQGQVPRAISFQGVLLDEAGNARADGTYELMLSLYDQESDGGALWSETQTVEVKDGVFSVNLGRVNPLDLGFDEAYWLGTKVDGGSELSPRIAFASSP